jgi:hypothetical protein
VQNNTDLQLLRDDLSQGESDSVEFKGNFPEQIREMAKVIASFASTHGGRIYLYINSRGEVTPNPLTNSGHEKDKFRLRISGIAKMVKPAITINVIFIDIDSGTTIARIDVPRGNRPVYYNHDTPYIRYLSESRPASPEEVEDLHRRFFEQQRSPVVPRIEGASEHEKATQFLVNLLFELSDAQLALSDVEEHYANPQRNQVQYDLGVTADQLLSLTVHPPIKRVDIDVSDLKTIGKELKELQNKKFYIGKQYWDEFISKGKDILQRINPTVDLVRKKITVNKTSKRNYKEMVESAIEQLKIDWEKAQTYEAGRSLEGLRDSFRAYGYRFHRLANLHEADEIDDVRKKLLMLSKKMRKLSSVKGWGLSTIGFSHIQHVKPHMKNNLETAEDILAILHSA